MKHFFNPMSRAMTTLWMFAELEVEPEQVFVDLQSGDAATAEFRMINPMGKIPVLVDDGVVVTEVAAICAYLADKFSEKGFAPVLGSPARGSYYRYMFVPGTTMEPMFTVKSMNVDNYSPMSAGFGDLERCLTTIEDMTPDTDWALGREFTAADIVFGGTLDFFIQTGALEEPSDKQRAYVRRLKDRPAYQKTHDPSWY
jgi:glutathione S-transferase